MEENVKQEDGKATVRMALATAIKLSEGKNFDSLNCGLRAYDNWINGLAHAKGGRPGFGTAYNAACWADYPGVSPSPS